MRRLTVVLAVILVLAAGLAAVSWSQFYEDAEDRQISEMSSSLESEMQGEEAEGRENMEEMDESMRGNEAPLGVADYE